MLLAWFLVPTVLAEEPVFAGTEKEAQVAEEVVTRLSAEFGGSYASGNTAFYTLAAALNGGREWDRNRLGVSGRALFGRGYVDTDGSGSISDPERAAGRIDTARQSAAEGRYDRFLSDNDSLYVLAGVLADPFAGYDMRSHEQIGYSRRLVNSETTEILAELGADYAQENYVDGVDPVYQDVFAARGLVSLHQEISASAVLDVRAEVYENVLDFADLRALGSVGITTKISDKFGLKLAHGVVFDNQPVEGFRPLDQLTTATLVASIF